MSFAITTNIINKNINWPDNKKFAFTIFDDTDGSNLNDNRLVYDYLNELGFKTTKSVWMQKVKIFENRAPNSMAGNLP